MAAQEQGRTIEQQFAVLRAPVAVSGRPSAFTQEQQERMASERFNSGFAIEGRHLRYTREGEVIDHNFAGVSPVVGEKLVLEAPKKQPSIEHEIAQLTPLAAVTEMRLFGLKA